MILITGASGMLGTNIVMEGIKRKEKIIAMYNTNPICFPNIMCIKADLSHEESIKKQIYSLRPKVIIHCAALTDVDWCEEHKHVTKIINECSSLYIAEAAQTINSLLVYISTDSVFDGKIGNYSEEDIPNPLNVYSTTKLAAELLIREKNKNSLVIRTNIYGWNLQDKLSMAEWMIHTLESHQKLLAFEDVIFSPILVNDLANMIFDMINIKLNGLYHIGSSDSCSKYEFANKLADIFNLDKKLIQPISIDSLKLKARRPKNSSLKTEKICLELGRQTPTLESGIKQFKFLNDSGFVKELKSYKGD